MQEFRKSTIKRDKIYVLLVTAILLFVFLAVFFLAFYGCRYSYYSSQDYTQRIYIRKDKVWIWLLVMIPLFIAVGYLSYLFDGVRKEVQARIGMGVLLVSCVWILTAWSFYVWNNPYYPVGDQLIVTAAASYAHNGTFDMFCPGGYIGMYQQQKGLVLIYEFIFMIFGDFNYEAAKQLHVFLAAGALAAGYHFLRLHTQKYFPGILFCGFFLLCQPLLLYMPYIYGDVPATSLCMILFWALTAFEKTGNKRYLAVAFPAASLAVLFRTNTWIILIAVVIGLLGTALKRGSGKFVITALLMILLPAVSVRAVDKLYEVRSGYESGIGIPSILWIAMGLQETNGAPGIYNRYQQGIFEKYEFEQEPAADEGIQYISNRLEEFRADPIQAIDFFKRKQQMQWLEPLFESLYSTHSFQEEKDVHEWVKSLYYGEIHDAVWKFANAYQGIVYVNVFLFVLIGLFGREKREKDSTFWIPILAFLGGFLFSLIWESQCRYVLPYFVFMLLYAPLGFEFPIRWWRKSRNLLTKYLPLH